LIKDLKILNEIKIKYPNVEVCGEPGISCTGCISKLDLDIFGLKYDGDDRTNQRSVCECLAIKKELLTWNKKIIVPIIVFIVIGKNFMNYKMKGLL